MFSIDFVLSLTACWFVKVQTPCYVQDIFWAMFGTRLVTQRTFSLVYFAFCGGYFYWSQNNDLRNGNRNMVKNTRVSQCKLA